MTDKKTQSLASEFARRVIMQGIPCQVCKGEGAVKAITGPASYITEPCVMCKGTGKLSGTSDEMRETSAGMLVSNILYDLAQFTRVRVREDAGMKPHEQSAIDLVRGIKRLIAEYENSYGEVK